MKSLVSIVIACGALSSLSVLSACGDDDEGGGASGGSAGTSSGGSAGSGGTSGGAGGSGGTGGSATGGSATGGGGTGGSGSHAVCADAQALADEHQTDLDCPNGTGSVEEDCEALLAQVPDCETEFEALQACGADQPAANWECDDDGEVNLVADACSEEALNVLLCAQ